MSADDSKEGLGLPVLLVAVFVFVQCFWVYERNLAWKTEESLWRDAARKSPRLSRPHIGLSRPLITAERIDEAISELVSAIRKNRFSRLVYKAKAHRNLGLCWLEKKRYKDAAIEYEKAVEIQPASADGWTGLALSRAGVGDFPGALDAMLKNLVIRRNIGTDRTVDYELLADIYGGAITPRGEWNAEDSNEREGSADGERKRTES